MSAVAPFGCSMDELHKRTRDCHLDRFFEMEGFTNWFSAQAETDKPDRRRWNHLIDRAEIFECYNDIAESAPPKLIQHFAFNRRTGKEIRIPAKDALDNLVIASLNDWTDQKEYWQECRAFLCLGLTRCVQEKCSEIDANFHSSIIISADGRHMLEPDWVAIKEGSDSYFALHLYSGEIFRDQKILYSDNIRGIDRPRIWQDSRGPISDPSTISSAVSWVCGGFKIDEPFQVFGCVVDERGRVASCLITSRNNCPETLPDNGEHSLHHLHRG